MTVTINDTTMTSDQTAHTARLAPGRQHRWEVSWLPGRVLDRNGATRGEWDALRDASYVVPTAGRFELSPAGKRVYTKAKVGRYF